MSGDSQPGDALPAMLAALPINPRNLAQLQAIQREVAALTKDRDDWRRELDLYAGSWLRNLGGRLFNKRHRIDAYAMTTAQMRVGYERARAAGLIGEEYYGRDRTEYPKPEEVAAAYRKGTPA